MFKRYFWLAHVLLITLAAVLSADIAKAYLRATFAQPSAPRHTTRQEAPLQQPRRTLKDYQAIAARNIFNAAPPPENGAAQPPPPPVTQPLEATQLQLRLVGTVAGTAEQLYAIIEDLQTRGQQAVYQVGDAIQNAFVVEIRSDCVVLDKAGQHELLCFNSEAVERQQGQQASVPGSAPPPPAPSQETADPSEDIQRIDTGTWQVSRDLLMEQFSNFGNLQQQARVVAHMVQGESRGFRFSSLRAGSVFQRLGLQSGDVMQRINGLSITSPEEALRAFQQLQSASTVRLEILRQGAQTTLTYELR